MCKKLMYLISFVLVVSLVQAAIGQDVDPDLAGWWKFNGDALDSSGNGRNGTLHGNPQFVTGYDGDALELDGDDWVNIDGYKGILGSHAFSICAWIRTSGDGEIVGWGSTGDGNRVEFRINGNRLRFEISGGYALGDTNVADNKWHHVAVAVPDNSTLVDIKIYLDGQVDMQIETQTNRIHPTGGNDVKMGIRYNGSGRELTGLIDDVRIYSRVLTAEEIQQVIMGVDPAPASEPIPVDAGDYRSILWRGEPVSVKLDASVYNEDLADDGVFKFQWSELCGPGSVEFLPSADIEDPCAVFAMPGIYTLLLQAWNEVLAEGSDIAVIHIRETRPGEALADDIAAWERLKNLEIPGIDTDSRFRITCANTRYVSPTGSDSNAGTIDSPWRTLSQAAASMAANRIIYLREGVYSGPVEIIFKGTSNQPSALRGYPGEHVIIQYPQSFIDENQAAEYYAPLIKIRGSYVEVSNLHLIGERDQLPEQYYSENGISFHNGGGEGCRILYNEIENVGHCGVKEMGHGGHHFLIEGNYIHDVGQTGHDHGIYCPADDATIRKNLITNSTGWGVHAYTAPARLEITHNIFSCHAGDGIVLGGPDCRILHNIFYHNTQGGIFFFRRHCRDNIVKNNIFDEPLGAFRHDSLGSNDQAEHPQNNLTDYNCLVPITPRGRPSPYDTYGPNNFTADPRWVNPDELDFRLTRTSPCIDAGEDEGYGSNCGPFYAPAPLSLSAEDFETGDFSRLPWEHSGDENWAVTLREKHSGAYSAKAGAIEDDGNTTLQVTLDCSDGDVAFYRKVSSESGSDYLKFYIDGVKQDEWSGEQDWIQISFPVTAGMHTFEWAYSKDGSESVGDDTAWIDDIVFPVN